MKKRQHRLKFETVSVLDNFLECIFPPRCFVCDRLLETADIRRQRNVHAACRKKLYPVVQPYCYHCGSPLADTETEYCQNCRKHRSFVAEGRSLFVYRGAVQKSMYRFKYANRRRYARFLAEEAMQRWENWMREKRIEAIVPVPMYSKKERYRGYNQAALFGRALSEKMDIPCIPRLMIRVKDTRPQKELNGRERENNVKNAFQSSDNVVEYKRILIVDDIYTTGSTVEAVAERLKEAGAEQVYVLTACIGRGF